jgi:hypothetical protein
MIERRWPRIIARYQPDAQRLGWHDAAPSSLWGKHPIVLTPLVSHSVLS